MSDSKYSGDGLPKVPEVEPSGRDFQKFLAENPSVLKWSSSRKDAMRIGDWLEIPMRVFKSWGGPILETSEQTSVETSDDRIVRVRITDIESPDAVDPSIVVEAQGLQKRVSGSLFYNRFGPDPALENDIRVSKGIGYGEGWAPPPEGGDSGVG